MTERTRKIIDSAWVPLPNTEWPNPGAQMIAQEWRYPRWGCDTVQRMVDMMDEVGIENDRLKEQIAELKGDIEPAIFAVEAQEEKDARILAEREWADKVLRLEAEVENFKRILRNIEGDCRNALALEHINAIRAAIGRVPTPEGKPAPSPEDEEVWDEKLQQEFLNASKERLREMLAADGLDYDELARKGRKLQERLKKENEERKAGL